MALWPCPHLDRVVKQWVWNAPDYPDTDDDLIRCPYGVAGDRLWVRETWAVWSKSDVFKKNPELIVYKEGGSRRPLTGQRWRPSIYMPRWASRITLEILEVRVERLQDISEQDAWAEGCERGEPTDNGGWFPKEQAHPKGGFIGWDCAVDWYADLWDSLHGDGSWEKNPWVWVIEFTLLNSALGVGR